MWSQLFENGRSTAVVLSDPCLVLFESMLKRQLSLNEYRNKFFGLLADEYLTDPVQNGIARTVAQSTCTHVVDAQLAAVFSVLNAKHSLSTEIVSARDFGVAYLSSHNVILLGSRRANPWVEYSEGLLNFSSIFEEAGPAKDAPRCPIFRTPRRGRARAQSISRSGAGADTAAWPLSRIPPAAEAYS